MNNPNTSNQTKHSVPKRKKPNFFYRKTERLFIWASGAYVEILDQVPQEKSKYFGIGGTIIFTALMASFAGGYAFFTAFKSIWLSIFFGVFWGCLILNLDRYIVSTFGVGDGKKTISLQELVEAFPRIIMAVLLGFVIATPLELKIFEREINYGIAKLIIEKQESQKNADETFYADLEKQRLHVEDLEQKMDALKKEKLGLEEGPPEYIAEQIKNLKGQVGEAKDAYSAAEKAYKTAYSNWKKAKDNPEEYTERIIAIRLSNRNQKKRQQDAALEEYQKLSKDLQDLETKGFGTIEERIDEVNREIATLQIELETEKALLAEIRLEEKGKKQNYKDIAERYNGFAAQLEALHLLTEEKPILWYANWLITILFIFIEVAPILFKMMTEKGPYDDILSRMKYEIEIRQNLIKSNINDEINNEVSINQKKMAEAKINQDKVNEDILKAVAEAQADIAIHAIDIWKQNEIKEITKNPSKILKKDNTKSNV